MYKLKTTNLLPLPLKDYSGRALPPGTRVLAMYPETSVFYNATVLNTARKGKKSGHYLNYTVAFDDDAPAGMEIPPRHVHFTHVINNSSTTSAATTTTNTNNTSSSHKSSKRK